MGLLGHLGRCCAYRPHKSRGCPGGSGTAGNNVATVLCTAHSRQPVPTPSMETVNIQLEGAPEMVAMAKQMLTSMQGLTVTVGPKPSAGAAGPAADTGSPGTPAGMPAIDAAALLPPVPPRNCPTQLTTFRDDWRHSGKVTVLAVDEENLRFLSGGDDRYIEVWKDDGSCVAKLDYENYQATTNSFDYHGKLGMVLANVIPPAGSGASSLCLWASTGDASFATRGCSTRPAAAKLHVVKALPETTGFITAETSGKRTNDILFWDIGDESVPFSSLKPKTTFARAHTDIVTCLAACPIDPAHIFISGSRDGAIRLWDLRTGATVGQLGETAHEGGVTCMDSTGYLLISAGADKTVKVWDLRNNSLLATFNTGKSESVGVAVAITANSSIRLAVLASEDKLWVLDYANEAAPVLEEAKGHGGGRNYLSIKWSEESGLLSAGCNYSHTHLFTLDC